MFRTHFAISCVAAVLPLFAQAPAPQVSGAAVSALPVPKQDFFFVSGGMQIPDAGGGPIAFYSHEFRFNSGKTVTGAPYSAERVVEHVQTLADGNRIVNTSTSKISRDSQGRTRVENTLPVLAGGPQPPTMITIVDPVAGVTYLLNSEKKAAQKFPSNPVATGKANQVPVPPPLPGGEVMIKATSGFVKPDVKTEDLGTQEINGVVAKGTRITETIPAGAIGNEMPIQTVSERWLSPDLQIMVKSVHTDPRMGQTTETLSSLTRGEPDASLFQVPSDYTIVDSPMPFVKTMTVKQP